MASASFTVYATLANACAAFRGEQFVGTLFPAKGAFGQTKRRVPVTVSSEEWTADPDDNIRENGIVSFIPRKIPARKFPAK